MTQVSISGDIEGFFLADTELDGHICKTKPAASGDPKGEMAAR
jgi:hypothetical protein